MSTANGFIQNPNNHPRILVVGPLVPIPEMNMQRKTFALALLGLAGLSQAAKPPIYDDFSSTTGLDRAKWFETEGWRFAEGKVLNLGRSVMGNTASDSGVNLENFFLNTLDSTPPKGLSADITVTGISHLESCAANPALGRTQARLVAAYFSSRAGGPVAGDRTGDIGAMFRVGRDSNSAAPAGELNVQGVVFECTNADCSTSTSPPVVNLGTTTIGTKVNGRIDWNKKTKTFQFTRDGGTPQSVVYTYANTGTPGSPFVNVSVRNEAPHCLSGPRTKVGMSAVYDNVGLSR